MKRTRRSFPRLVGRAGGDDLIIVQILIGARKISLLDAHSIGGLKLYGQLYELKKVIRDAASDDEQAAPIQADDGAESDLPRKDTAGDRKSVV